MEPFVSDFNRLAYLSVQRFKLNEAPGVTLLYGPAGVGKSYWLEILYQRLKSRNPGLRIQRLNAQNYVQQYAYSAQLHNLSSFRSRLRTTQLLMFDDLQFLRGKLKSIEELLYTYEYLSAGEGRLIVNLQGVAPDLEFLGERLSSRLLSGQAIPIFSPTPVELEAFIRQYCRYHHLVVEEQALEQMAFLVTNLGEVQQVVRGFVRFAENRESALTWECFSRFWDELCLSQGHRPTLDNIIRITAEVLGVPSADIQGERRTRPLVAARQLAMYLSKQLGAASYSEIGRYYRRRHSAVIEACRQMDIKLVNNQELRESYRKICSFFED